MEVKRISATDTLIIRNQVLRPQSSTTDYIFHGDNDEQSFHLGAFVDKKLVSVASFFFQHSPQLGQDVQYRLRGMATLPELQGRGFSKALLKTAFPIIKQNQGKVVWCHAREKAIGFYLSVGFQKKGELFDVPLIGPHLFMYKEITAD